MPVRGEFESESAREHHKRATTKDALEQQHKKTTSKAKIIVDKKNIAPTSACNVATFVDRSSPPLASAAAEAAPPSASPSPAKDLAAPPSAAYPES